MQTKYKLDNAELFVKLYSEQRNWKLKVPRKSKTENLKIGKVRFCLIVDVGKEKKDSWLKVIKTTIGGGGNRGVNLPSSYFLSQFLPPPYFFEPISHSSLNDHVSFSSSSLLFPPISPSSQLFLGHFSLLPILFLPPLERTPLL